jgi:hypothetical protein
MANKSSQSADYQRTNTRAQNALNKAVKAEPKTIPSAGNARNINKAMSVMDQSRTKVGMLSNTAKKAAISSLANKSMSKILKNK